MSWDLRRGIVHLNESEPVPRGPRGFTWRFQARRDSLTDVGAPWHRAKVPAGRTKRRPRAAMTKWPGSTTFLAPPEIMRLAEGNTLSGLPGARWRADTRV
jgi:hypothetical protein